MSITEKTRNEIRKMFLSGLRCTEISDLLNVPESTVRYICLQYFYIKEKVRDS